MENKFEKGVVDVGFTKKFSCGIVFCAVLVLSASQAAEAAFMRQYTFVNKNNFTVQVALADEDTLVAKGWFNVKGGETRTINFSVINEGTEVTYYARGSGYDWKMSEDDFEAHRKFYVHPTKSFVCAYGDQGIYGEMGGEKYDLAKRNRVPQGAMYVPFKSLGKAPSKTITLQW